MDRIPSMEPLSAVAARLHVTSRRLREHLRMHPIGRKIGRQILFTEADVLQLISTLELVGGSTAMHAKPSRRSAYAAHTSDKSLAEALALCTEKLRKKSRR